MELWYYTLYILLNAAYSQYNQLKCIQWKLKGNVAQYLWFLLLENILHYCVLIEAALSTWIYSPTSPNTE